jgi:hypothetical protein
MTELALGLFFLLWGIARYFLTIKIIGRIVR